MKLRRPRNTTLASIIIFLISFGFWLTQPQAPRVQSNVQFPEVSWVFVTTTEAPQPVETTVPIVETTVPVVETTLPPETLPPETTLDTTVATTTVP